MSDIDVLFEQIPVKGGVLGRITLNRPDQINVLSTEMCQRIYQQLQVWQDDADVVAVILRGAGERGFCAGGDLKEIYQHGFDNPQGGQTFFWHEYRLNHIIYHYPKPIICLLHGVVMGGGVGISLYTRYRIAADNLCWAMPEVKIGLFPDAGVSYFLSRLPQHLGLYLALSGVHLDAKQALAWGCIDYLVKPEQLATIEQAFSQLDWASDVTSQLEQLCKTSAVMSADNGLKIDNEKAIAQCFSTQDLAEIKKHLVNDKGHWAKSALEAIMVGSPLSLALVLDLLKQASHLDFDHCLKQEYRATFHLLRLPDIYRGIDAAVVAKHRKPQWQVTGSMVSYSLIDELLAVPSDGQELSFDVMETV